MKIWRRRAGDLEPPLPSSAMLPVEVTASEVRLEERRCRRHSPCGPPRRVAEASCRHSASSWVEASVSEPADIAAGPGVRRSSRVAGRRPIARCESSYPVGLGYCLPCWSRWPWCCCRRGYCRASPGCYPARYFRLRRCRCHRGYCPASLGCSGCYPVWYCRWPWCRCHRGYCPANPGCYPMG
jgi:hypothetical protein